MKREEAATTLASARRGQLARGDRKSKKKEAADRELAAAKLQAVTRGHQGREAADEVREQKRIEALVAKREADEQRQLADDPTGGGGGSASAFFDGASGMFGAMLGGAMGSGFGGGAPQQRGDARKTGAKKKKDTDGEYFGDGWCVFFLPLPLSLPAVPLLTPPHPLPPQVRVLVRQAQATVLLQPGDQHHAVVRPRHGPRG